MPETPATLRRPVRDPSAASITEAEAVSRMRALRARIDADNARRRASGLPVITQKRVSRERGSVTDGELIYDRGVFSMQEGKRSLLRVVELEAAYGRLLASSPQRETVEVSP